MIEATKGVLLCGNENQIITRLSTDSRDMSESTLFVPLIGERVDGHKYIESALTFGGATLTMNHTSMDDTHPWIQVDDTLKAMQRIGTYYRSLMDLPVIAVTGSVGKTTTRDMIGKALTTSFHVFQTEGNFNSQVGVPITLARMSQKDEVAVLEAGISMEGEMAILAQMIQPDIAVFTNIGVAHIENLKNQDNICKEKMELAKALPKEGVVFLNGDDEILVKHSLDLKNPVIYYGLSKLCDYRGKNIRIENNQTHFDCVCHGNTYPVVLNVLGTHNVQNALVAIAVAKRLGVPVSVSSKAFLDFEGLRQKVYQIHNYTLIDDTYNASPDSMKASLNVLSQMEGSGRKIAVLADMLELGDQTKEYHYEVGTFIGDKNIDEVYAVGNLSQYIINGINDSTTDMVTCMFDNNGELLQYLQETIAGGDIVLLKGSNGMCLKNVVNSLLNE